MSEYEKLADLPLVVESCRLEGRMLTVSSGFERHTTLVRLAGLGVEGVGEEVTYDAGDQKKFQRGAGAMIPNGRFSLDEFSRRIGELNLFPAAPRYAESRDYRRWAVESAALDLALQQAGESLAGRLEILPRPLRFVVSMGLGPSPSVAPLERLLEICPGTRFKLDASSSWPVELFAELAALGVVDVVDLKGAYHGTPVDQSPDPLLYQRVAELLPGVWIEDPALTEATRPVLAEHFDRVTWDAPIHAVADIEALEHTPRMLNIKPSRFGSVRRLLEACEHCSRCGIAMYGGGQFELQRGRDQIQYLAALFYPDGPNDVSPVQYHDVAERSELPAGPLDPRPAASGFRWA